MKNFKLNSVLLVFLLLIVAPHVTSNSIIESTGKNLNKETVESDNTNFPKGTVIGKVEDGKYVITADLAYLKKMFADMASEQGLGTVTYTKFEILKMEVGSTIPTQY